VNESDLDPLHLLYPAAQRCTVLSLGLRSNSVQVDVITADVLGTLQQVQVTITTSLRHVNQESLG
jgi:hypothetical protein